MSDDKFEVDPALRESAEAAREALAEQADALFEALFSNATTAAKPEEPGAEPAFPAPSLPPPAPPLPAAAARPAPPPPPSTRKKIAPELQHAPPRASVLPSAGGDATNTPLPLGSRPSQFPQPSLPPPPLWSEEVTPPSGTKLTEAEATPIYRRAPEELPPLTPGPRGPAIFPGFSNLSASTTPLPSAPSMIPSIEKTAMPPDANLAQPLAIEGAPSIEAEPFDALAALISGSPSPPPSAAAPIDPADAFKGDDTIPEASPTEEFEAYVELDELGLGDDRTEVTPNPEQPPKPVAAPPSEPSFRIEKEADVAPVSLPVPEVEPPIAPTFAWNASTTERRATPAPEEPRKKVPSFPAAPMPESWLERATFLESEAEAQADTERKGRTLLLASELWAIAGDRERSRALSNQATSLLGTTTLAMRQQRQLAAHDQDWKSVTKTLDLEEQTARHPAIAAHACYLGSEVRRLKLGDSHGASQKLERLEHYLPSDPRPALMRYARQLATDTSVPKLRFSDSLSSAGLPRALERTRQLRSEGPSGVAGDRDPVLAFEDARRALAIGDRLHASQALADLTKVPGLEMAARWFAAALLAPSAATRGEAIDLLLELHEETKSRAAARALAALALEEGDGAAMNAALDSDNTSAFLQLERVLLATLSGALSEELSDLVDTLGSVGVAGAAAFAIRKALGFSDDTSLTPSGPMAKYSELGHALAQGAETDAVNDQLAVLAAADPANPAILLFRLERAYQTKDRAAVAQRIASWPAKDGDPDPHLASGLLYELARDSNAAVAAYRTALSFGLDLQATERAVAQLTQDPATELAIKLETLAARTHDGEAAALLLIESAHRVGSAKPERFEELLTQAVERNPSLPFAYRLLDGLARSRGDVALLTSWLARWRHVASSPLEVAISSVREALLLAEEDGQRASECLKEALRAFPRDMALRELFERVNRPEAQRTRWREAAADRAKDNRSQARLLLEAVFETADPAEACRLADRARELSPSDSIANVVYERLAETSGNAAFGAALALETERDASARARSETFDRLARLAVAEGKPNEAERFWQAILETSPDHLPTLRALEQAFIVSGREDDLEPIAERLALLLSDGEAVAHAFCCERIRSRQGKLKDAGPTVLHVVKQPSAPLWLLRAAAAQSHLNGDKRGEIEAYSRILASASTPDDVATLCLRAAELALEIGDHELARQLLDRALAAVPEHLVLLSTKVEFHRNLGELEALARALQFFAAASQVAEHKVQALLEAGILWLDQIGNNERGEASLEAASAITPENSEVFERLRRHYERTNQRVKLAKLLETRMAHAGADERASVEIGRAKALAEIGEGPAARAALSAMLKANPEQTDALEAYAKLSLAEDEPKAAEAAWLQLARITQDSSKQALYYRNLAELYQDTLRNPERAALCYREVLKRTPNDVFTAERLIGLYQELDQGNAAAELQARLLDGARNDAERAAWTAKLAEIYELSCHDRDRALALLQQARASWPKSSVIVRALAEVYLRSGDSAAFDSLLESAGDAARRNLATNLDEEAFHLLVTISGLMGNGDAAKVIAATWSALQAQESIVDGAGPVAGDHGVEEFLAPELLAPSLRSLFEKAGDALDHATPPRIDVTRLKSLSEEQPDLEHWYGDLAQAFGVVGLTLLVSPSITFDVVAARSAPPTIVFGEALLERGDREAVTFLFYRALKLVQAKMCAIANAAPTERELYLNAFLKAFVSDFQPAGNQLGLLPLALRIQGELPEGALEHHATLARAAIQDAGHRTAQIGAALERWVSRTALFAVGNPAAALRGLALQTGSGSALPENPTERVKWAMRTPAARELVVFSASKEYDAARLQVGLGLDDQGGLGLDEIDVADEVDDVEEIADDDVSDL